MPARPLYSVAQAREFDRRAIEERGLPGYTLMTRAGEAAARQLLRRFPLAERINVLAGPGNNGGDGYVVARALKQAGREVRLLCLVDRLPDGDAGRARSDWLAAGGTCERLSESLPPADVQVDALFGIGLGRPLEGLAAAAVAALNACAAPVLALDLPSGLDADSGHAAGAVVQATLTISFIVDKAGLHTGLGPACCGEIVLETLDLPSAWLADAAPVAWLLQRDQLREHLPARQRDGHKGRYGHVLLLGGDAGYGGAIRLAGEAAARSGAGLVSVVTRPAHVGPLLAARPELMLRGLDDPAAAAELIERASVIVAGPGLGKAPWGRALLELALRADRSMVLDADALNLLAEAPRPLSARTILTPHPAEAARLLGWTTARVQANRWQALAELVQAYRCVVVLKGAGSLIGAPGSTPSVCPYGNPGMATGGTGDVLAGVLGALLGQGLEPATAAMVGVIAHALAGDEAAREGERGMLASDLLAPLRSVLNPPAATT
jgi:NAD(P)H-hydrate epimerase